MLTSAVRQKRSGQADCLKTIIVPLTAFTTLRFQFKTRRPNNLTVTFYDFHSFSTSATQHCSQYFWKMVIGSALQASWSIFPVSMTQPSCSAKTHLDISAWKETSFCQQELLLWQCCSSSTAIVCMCAIQLLVCVCVTQFNAPHGDLFVFFHLEYSCLIQIGDSFTDLGHGKSAGLYDHSFHGFLRLHTRPVDRSSRRMEKEFTPPSALHRDR